jgi:hypothetical protein
MTSTVSPAAVATTVRRRPLERLEAELVELAGQMAGVTARYISLIGEFDEAEGWREWGMKLVVELTPDEATNLDETS